MLDKPRKSPNETGGDLVDELLEASEEAGPIYVSDEEWGVQRLVVDGEFAYFSPRGQRIRNDQALKRIRSLAAPPAYTDVWICSKPNGHIQATGRDLRGRKQYRYHPRWIEARDQTKYQHMLQFAAALPETELQEDLAWLGPEEAAVLALLNNRLESEIGRVPSH
jgi:DNA topoisomerase-1